MSLVSTSGFAIRRNGSCLASEVDCGATVSPFRACCPSGASCPSAFNVECCPSPANCTQTLLKNPSCANKTWTLYDNEGYFCCEPGTVGYAALKSGSDGCADPGVSLNGAEVLSVVSAGQTARPHSTSTTTSKTTSPTHTKSSNSSPTTSDSAGGNNSTSHSNSGAIAGGVVGGVAGVAILSILIWLFLRRKAKVKSIDAPARSERPKFFEKDASTRTPDVHEASGEPTTYELPDNRQTGHPVELP